MFKVSVQEGRGNPDRRYIAAWNWLIAASGELARFWCSTRSVATLRDWRMVAGRVVKLLAKPLEGRFSWSVQTGD